MKRGTRDPEEHPAHVSLRRTRGDHAPKPSHRSYNDHTVQQLQPWPQDGRSEGASGAAIARSPRAPGTSRREQAPPTWMASSMKTTAWSKHRSRLATAPAGGGDTQGEEGAQEALTRYRATESKARTRLHSSQGSGTRRLLPGSACVHAHRAGPPRAGPQVGQGLSVGSGPRGEAAPTVPTPWGGVAEGTKQPVRRNQAQGAQTPAPHLLAQRLRAVGLSSPCPSPPVKWGC